MHQFNRFRGTKGWLWLYERQLRLVTMNNQPEAEHRLRILIFWEKHGDEAAMEAYSVSRRTLYRWQAALRKESGKLNALDKRSTAPKKRNTRRIPPDLAEKIIMLRTNHPRLGKDKIARILKKGEFNVSESYIGRVLNELKKRNLLPQYRKVSWYARSGKMRERIPRKHKKIRRPKEKRGLEIDTVVRFVNGAKRYIYTAINLEDRFGFAATYTTHSSATATDFLTKLITVAPFTISEIQTDNGSEFAHHFHDACDALSIRHYHTYPRCPKMNGTVERFNRTLSEDFIRHHLPVLRDDVPRFNVLLIDWLIWYNTERPHQSLGGLAPLEYYVKSLSAEECQMWWTRTETIHV